MHENDPSYEIRRSLRQLAIATVILYIVALLAVVIGVVYTRHEVVARTHQINQSRKDITFQGCRDQNDRNRQTVKALDLLIDQAAKTSSPEQIHQLNQSRTFTVYLINALVPIHDCAKQLAERFPGE